MTEMTENLVEVNYQRICDTNGFCMVKIIPKTDENRIKNTEENQIKKEGDNNQDVKIEVKTEIVEVEKKIQEQTNTQIQKKKVKSGFKAAKK